MSPLSASPGKHSFKLIHGDRNKDSNPCSPILASAKIHIEPTSRPIPILPIQSTVDLSSASTLIASPNLNTYDHSTAKFQNQGKADMRTKRFSTGPHPLLPTVISSDIHAFQLDSFAEQYFAKRRTGIMRTRVPLVRVLTWQKAPITAPLLEATGKAYGKEAVVAFKVIQRAMCERDKAVEGARPLKATSVAELETMPSNKLAGLGLGEVEGPRYEQGKSAMSVGGEQMAYGHGSGPGHGQRANATVQILDEVRWMIQVAVFAQEMRDEVYAQLVKQLTGNQSLCVFPLILHLKAHTRCLKEI